MGRRILPARLVTAAVAVCLTCAGPAAAQAPVVDGYGGAGAVANEVAGGAGAASAAPGAASAAPGAASAAPGSGSGDVVSETAGAAPTASVQAPPVAKPALRDATGAQPVPAIGANDLPFTGLDLALICAGGLLLMGIGVVARWLSRPRAPQT